MRGNTDPHWEKAAHIYANYLIDHALPDLIATRKSGPETLPAYALWRQVQGGKARAAEITGFPIRSRSDAD